MIAPLLAGIAPYIANAIGGLLHDKAAEAIKSATGIDISADTAKDQLSNLTEQQKDLIKNADNDFKIKYFEKVNEALKIVADDMSNSRNMQNDPVNKMRTEYMRSNTGLLLMSIVGAFYLYSKGEISGAEDTLIGIIIGGLLQKNGTVGDFLMGGAAKMMNFVSKSMKKA